MGQSIELWASGDAFSHDTVYLTLCYVLETFHCVKDGNTADVSVSLTRYKWDTLMPLKYDEYIGEAAGGTETNPLGKQVPYLEVPITAGAPLICSATMPNADTPEANYTHTMSIPVSLPAAGAVECGMWWVSIHHAVITFEPGHSIPYKIAFAPSELRSICEHAQSLFSLRCVLCR